MKKSQDKDPYLSELDAIDDFEAAPPEEATEVDAPTRIDVKAPPMAVPQMPPPPASFEEEEMAEHAPAISLDDLSLSEPAIEDVPEGPPPIKEILELAPDLAVPLLIVMGRKSFTVQDLLGLRMGQIMDLDRAPLEPVDLVAAGKVIGKGELVEVDGKIGVRILKLFK